MQKTKKKPKSKKKKAKRIKVKELPTYTQIKQMVEATCRRMLLEPVQQTQSPDIIVFQNGVLDLKCENPAFAFKADMEAPVKYSHAVWSYFDAEIWDMLVGANSHLISSENKKDHFSRLRSHCRELCPVFSRYMEEWFPKDRAAFEVILRWFGYSMTTDHRQQKFMFFYGPTRAGKGSLARLLCGIVGSVNYSSANYRALEDKFEAIGMHDKIVVAMEEVEATPKEHEKRLGMLKKYLGGERVSWQDKHVKMFEDTFHGKIIMQSNEVLAYEDKGRSITARMIPVEFKESFEGVGAEPPEQIIFKSGEANAIGTIAAMMWYRMCRNRVRGAFDFKKNEDWSIGKCKACRSGKGTLLLESHKILWPFLHVFLDKDVDTKSQVKEGKLVRATRGNLKELTEKVIDITSRKEIPGNLQKMIRDAVSRDFPEAKEKYFRNKDLGRYRGWKNLYIDMRGLSEEYPEAVENVREYEDPMLRLLN